MAGRRVTLGLANEVSRVCVNLIMLNYILVSIKGIKSFDLVLHEQLKLL